MFFFSKKRKTKGREKSLNYYIRFINTHTERALRFISTTNANQPLLSNDITFAWLVVVVYVVIIIQ